MFSSDDATPDKSRGGTSFVTSEGNFSPSEMSSIKNWGVTTAVGVVLDSMFDKFLSFDIKFTFSACFREKSAFSINNSLSAIESPLSNSAIGTGTLLLGIGFGTSIFSSEIFSARLKI